jgi:hypothetical protein
MHGRTSGPSLTPSSVVPRARAVLRPPPTPSRLTGRFPGRRLSTSAAPARTADAARKGPVPVATLPAFRAPYAGSSSGPRSRLSTAAMAFAVRDAGSALPLPRQAAGTPSAREAPLDAMDRAVAPPKGFRRRASTRPVSGQSRRPAIGPPAASRTGLPPAGSDELMLDQITPTDHLQLSRTPGTWCRTRVGRNPRGPYKPL